jgi:hypothetical protein
MSTHIIDEQCKGIVFHPSWLVDQAETVTDIADLVCARVLLGAGVPALIPALRQRTACCLSRRWRALWC